MFTYPIIIFFSWAVFFLVWAIFAFNVKKDIRGGYSGMWSGYRFILVLVVAFLVFVIIRVAQGAVNHAGLASILGRTAFSPPILLGWIGAGMVVLGFLFAIWARFHLGRNWSSRPAVKENHELVTSGPYRYVRHPIYSGYMLAALGTALTGSYYGIAVMIITSIIFFVRIGKEELLMQELFPDEYSAYKAHTKKLIPFIF